MQKACGEALSLLWPARHAVLFMTRLRPVHTLLPATDDENIFGQTADFPGIGSQAERSFADSAEAAWHAQQEAEEVCRRQEREQQRLQVTSRTTVGNALLHNVDPFVCSTKSCQSSPQPT